MRLWSWLRRAERRPTRTVRPRPDGWAKTVEDLMAEKRTVSGEQLEWARTYERERLRTWARFPHDGEVLEAVRDVDVDYLVHWAAPFTGGGRTRLAAGARVRVSVDGRDPEPIGVHATPLDDRRLEARLVPDAHRSSPKYGGFNLYLPVEQLNRDFRLVGGARRP